MSSNTSCSSCAASSAATAATPVPWSAEFLAKYDTIVFDCDGVIWRGSHFLPGMAETLTHLASLGKTVLYCSNNSTKSRQDYVDKFAAQNVPVQPSHVYSSASTIASLLLATDGFDAARDKVYVIGFTGLKQELRESGIQIIDADDVAPSSLGMSGLAAVTPDPALRAVVVGLDPSMSYCKAAYATLLLLERNALFFATNRDATFPGARRTLPGAGSCVAMVAAAAGREPSVAGKPSRAMFTALAADHGAVPSRTLMVGDRLDTDIAFANASNMDSLLVFTGVTERDAFAVKRASGGLPQAHTPTYTADGACVLAGVEFVPWTAPAESASAPEPLGSETPVAAVATVSIGVVELPDSTQENKLAV